MTETAQELDVEVPDEAAPENGAVEAPATPAATAVATTKAPLPEGIVSPIQARNHLVTKGLAPATLKPQQMYGFVKSPGKANPFPVKHYDADGSVHDEPQISEHGVTTSRPGVELAKIETWWAAHEQAKVDRNNAKLAKIAADKAKAEAAAAGTPPADGTATPEVAPAADGEAVEAE
jgi:hypothetical protein